MDLQTIIRQKRTAKAWSQQDLAEAVGIHVRSIQRIESGKSIPHPYTLNKLAKILDIDLGELANGKDLDLNKYKSILHFSVITYLILPVGNLLVPWFINYTLDRKGFDLNATTMRIIKVQFVVFLIDLLLFGIYIFFKINSINVDPFPQPYALLLVFNAINVLVYLSLGAYYLFRRGG